MQSSESIGDEVKNWPNHSWYKHPKKKKAINKV